ncbi:MULTISPECIES: ParB/RepB/Spo0J family partition protein [Mycobacterium]|uniref:ParB/RepB/Spo0J family partition protein n=1 Tax=Mycobacterium TaxID=1763 RepID=UPI0005F08FCD|nr:MULTISPECIES: ParB/RepB/Spo0J family partition protein [Mycobacterium]MCV7034910.1 ParB/RepB/Spo0J family partition protein [Mycobacterium heckeshornense]
MARGQRTSLASLASAVGDNSPVDQSISHYPSRSAPLSDLTPNPRNPRDDVGDLDDLASIADIQLQPAVVVSRGAYQRLYPDDEIATRWVVINGCRRLAAAHKYGRHDLDIVVKDEIARDKATLITAAISENIDRTDFDVLEEARAVETLVQECGRADAAAARLRKSEGWVSQRRALLALTPELQIALRQGEMAIRVARSIARLPTEDQVAAWLAAQQQAEDHAGEKPQERRDRGGQATPARTRIITRALRKFDSEPQLLADALRRYLGDDGVQALVRLLANGSSHQTT